MKKINFGAGPCILPQSVFELAAEAIIDYDQLGLSILEISHRSHAFVEVMEEARSLVLELMNLDASSYTALYLQGGASQQFAMVPYNFLSNTAAYVDTGVWSQKAISEAKKVGRAETIASSKENGYKSIPEKISIEHSYDYVHLTSNNTIYGTQFDAFPSFNETPMIADMSSDILSRPRNYAAFDLIYAGAQKNIGPAGTTLVVVKKDFLQHVNGLDRFKFLDYNAHSKADSMLNTPTVFSIYASLLNLRWIKEQGLDSIFSENQQKAALLYATLEKHNWISLFAERSSRSSMNVTFTIPDASHAALFDSYCKKYDIHGLKGHRLVGGYRASLYNALSLSNVKILTDVIDEVNTHV